MNIGGSSHDITRMRRQRSEVREVKDDRVLQGILITKLKELDNTQATRFRNIGLTTSIIDGSDCCVKSLTLLLNKIKPQVFNDEISKFIITLCTHRNKVFCSLSLTYPATLQTVFKQTIDDVEFHNDNDKTISDCTKDLNKLYNSIKQNIGGKLFTIMQDSDYRELNNPLNMKEEFSFFEASGTICTEVPSENSSESINTVESHKELILEIEKLKQENAELKGASQQLLNNNSLQLNPTGF